MAQLLSAVAVGTTVKIKEYGNPVDYIVVHQGNPSPDIYDASCDGTWVWRKENWGAVNWGTSQGNYGNSTLNAYLNGTNFSMLANSPISDAIKQVKIPYCTGRNSQGLIDVASGGNGLLCKAFALSAVELNSGGIPSGTVVAQDGVALDYFATGEKSRRLPSGWTRTSYGSSDAWCISSDGDLGHSAVYSPLNARPAIILDGDIVIVDDSGNTSLAPPAPSTISLADMAMQGQPVTASWSAVDGADSYILERKANTDSDWTQVYSGANLTYTETAGTWTSVQYRVKAGVSGVYGDYTTSEAISVVSASALVISGTDSDLGTLTAPVGYSVSSDTGNTITVTEQVNGVALRTYTATSGQKQSIPIPDLPTGSGSITIKASVQATAGTVNQTRNWTYTKTAPTFPSGPFDISTLSKGGKTQFPLTLAECVKFPLGGSPAMIFSKGYHKHTGHIGDLPIGTTVSFDLDGTPTDFIVVNQGIPGNNALYDASCDGTWLMQKDLYGYQEIYGASSNYADSNVNSDLNSDYLGKINAAVAAHIKQVKIPYVNGPTSASPVVSGENGLSCKVFLPSIDEMGLTSTTVTLGAAVSYFAGADNDKRIAKYNGVARAYATRTPNASTSNVFGVATTGGSTAGATNLANWSYRPTFVMEPDYGTYTWYTDSDGNICTEAEYLASLSIAGLDGNPVGVKIATGSYVGTGTWGQSNPNTLTFDFKPSLVIIAPSSTDYSLQTSGIYIWGNALMPTVGAEGSVNNIVNVDGNTMTWYADRDFNSSYGQFNTKRTYYYLAIGTGGGG